MKKDNRTTKKDYAESKYGFQSLADLLRFIDDETPDPDRLHAAKAMFFNLISVDTNSGNETLKYKLFHLSKSLTATQLAILSAVYNIYKRDPNHGFSGGANAWLNEVSKEMGHGVKSLVESEEKALEDYSLITPRIHADRSGVNPNNCRFTDLGIKFCERLADYGKELS